jgi:putative DNA primase/helicase
MQKAADIHARIGANWPLVLRQLGIAEPHLRIKKPGPCPACGGTDRFTFDNRTGKGDFFCRGCGAGDGFTLLMKLHGWPFAEARRRVIAAAGLTAHPADRDAAPAGRHPESGHAQTWSPNATGFRSARPTSRVWTLLRTSCDVVDCLDALAYLDSRKLWPLPADCTLRAHPSVEYWDAGQRLGRYAALIAVVHDADGEVVTAHVTYLAAGRKLEAQAPRKLLSPLTGRLGCAVHLVPPSDDCMGIAEGIETALSAEQLHGVPVWAALTAGLLAKFEPPDKVRRLLIFADADAAGLQAAARLLERLQGRVCMELRTPAAGAKDWNDALMKCTK